MFREDLADAGGGHVHRAAVREADRGGGLGEREKVEGDVEVVIVLGGGGGGEEVALATATRVHGGGWVHWR